MGLTSVELHKGRDQLFDRQGVVLHHLGEALRARLHGRVGDEQHFHQLGDQVGVPDVILTADEHHQESDNVLDTWLVQDLRGIPGNKVRKHAGMSVSQITHDT